MLSGGLDSCYMLYYYLTQTDHDVHAHYISLRYPSESRWREEDIASRKIVEYCRSIRVFDYTESRFDIGFKRYVGRDSIDYPLGEHISREILYPLMEMNMTKATMMAALPQELREITWSCRRPVYDESGASHPCGQCKPCMTIRNIDGLVLC